MKLTKRVLDTLKTSNPRGQRYYDTETRGFGVRVMPDGSIHFEVRYGGRRNRHRMAIGRYGALTIDDARDHAKQLLASAIKGQDPAAARKRAKEMPTFCKWRETYSGRIAGRLKSAKWIDRFLEIAEDRWKSKPLDSIRTEDVEALFQKIGEESRTSANRWLQTVRASFSQAVRDGLLQANPASRITLYQENPPRSRVLTDDEMESLINAIEKEPDVHAKAALRLLIESGARLSEVLSAKWEDVDLDGGLWRIPSPKSGRPQMAPLGRMTVAMLRRLPKLEGCPYVIVGRQKDKPRYDLKGPWLRALTTAKLTDAEINVHDLRRTFGLTIARQSRGNLQLASKLLRHSSIKITEQVYVPLGIEELKKAVEKRGRALTFKKRSAK